MNRRLLTLFASLVSLSPLALAQEAPPGPAPELQKFAPLIGNWHGTGKMSEPSGVETAWTARGTYRWCLDGHFVREDFMVAFEGMPAPMVMHGYLGWDRETKQYVQVRIDSGGRVQRSRLVVGNDGSIMNLGVQLQGGTLYAERALLTVKGDTLTHALDMLMAKGPSMQIVDGKFTRGGEAFDGAFDTAPFLATANEAIRKLGRSAGAFDTAGAVTMAPGQAPMQIHGVDTFRAAFGGTVLHGHTEGAAEGMPGKYVGEVFWGFDEAMDCLLAVYVSNLGEVMTMEGRWSADGQLIATSNGVWMGQPMVQRMLMQFDASGAPVSAVSHSILGTGAPYESFRATYAKKK